MKLPKFSRLERGLREARRDQAEFLRAADERLQDGERLEAWPTKGRYIERFKDVAGLHDSDLDKIKEEVAASDAAWKELLAELRRDPRTLAHRIHVLDFLRNAPKKRAGGGMLSFGEHLRQGLVAGNYDSVELDLDRTMTIGVPVDGDVVWPNSTYNDPEIFPDKWRLGFLDAADILGLDTLVEDHPSRFREARELGKVLDKKYYERNYAATAAIHREICAAIRGLFKKFDERDILRMWLTTAFKNIKLDERESGLVRQELPRWLLTLRSFGIKHVAVKSGAESRLLRFLTPLEELNALLPRRLKFKTTAELGSLWNFDKRGEFDVYMMVGPPKSVSVFDTLNRGANWVRKFKDVKVNYMDAESSEFAEPYSSRIGVAAGDFVLRDGYLQLVKPQMSLSKRKTLSMARRLETVYGFGDSWSDVAMLEGAAEGRMVMISPEERHAALEREAMNVDMPVYFVEDFEDGLEIPRAGLEARAQLLLMRFGDILRVTQGLAKLRALEENEDAYLDCLEQLIKEWRTLPYSRHLRFVELARQEREAIKVGVSERPLRGHPLYKRDEAVARFLVGAYKNFTKKDKSLMDESLRLRLRWHIGALTEARRRSDYMRAAELTMRDVYATLERQFIESETVEIEKWKKRLYGGPGTPTGNEALLGEMLHKNLHGFNSALGGKAAKATT